MAQLITAGFDTEGLSDSGLKVLKAAWSQVQAHKHVELHFLPMDEFCSAAGLPSMSVESMGTLLREAQRVVVWLEGSDLEAPQDMTCGFSSPMFDIAHATGETIQLKAFKRVLEATSLPDVLSLRLSTRTGLAR